MILQQRHIQPALQTPGGSATFSDLPSKPLIRPRSNSRPKHSLQDCHAASRVADELNSRRRDLLICTAAPSTVASKARAAPTTLDVFLAFASAIFPALEGHEALHRRPDFEQIDASQHHQTLSKAFEASQKAVPRKTRELLDRSFNELLDTHSPLMVSMCGSVQSQTFPELTYARRARFLQAWARTRDPSQMKAFNVLKALVTTTLMFSPDLVSTFWEAMEYPGPIPAEERRPTSHRLEAEARLLPGLINMRLMADEHPADIDRLAEAMRDVGLQARAGDEGKVEVACDVVIVGSGAGGAAAASVLCRAGHRVVLLEKGTFTPAAELTLHEGQALSQMYEEGCRLKNDSTSMIVMAGATVGGGTRINWGISFETPDKVREQWAREHGIPWYMDQEYTEALAETCSRYAVTKNETHSRQNQLLKEGLDILGMHADLTPRNIRDPQDQCGYTTLGCPRGNKQVSKQKQEDLMKIDAFELVSVRQLLTAFKHREGSIWQWYHAREDTSGSWLPDAVDGGAKILTGVRAVQVLTQPSDALSGLGQRQAHGISAEVQTSDGSIRQLEIVAPAVICAGNAIQTPALLLRSDITGQGNVGAHLQCHPIASVRAVFPQEHGPVHPWKGSVTTWFNREIGDWNNSGYGAWLHTSNSHPAAFMNSTAWSSATDFKRRMLDYPQTCLMAVFMRDSSEGRVYLDDDGRPSIAYKLNDRDRRLMIEGTQGAARIMRAAGAERIMLAHPDLTWERPSAATQASMSPQDLDDDFQAFMDRIDGTFSHPDYVEASAPYTSAHQMGTARMGADPSTSVCDPNGESWDVSGLFVCDGAALPTSIGANPMITISATAVVLAKRLSQALLN